MHFSQRVLQLNNICHVQPDDYKSGMIRMKINVNSGCQVYNFG